VYPAPVRGPPEPPVDLADCAVQRAVEVTGGSFSADDRAPRVAGDLNALAVVGLSRIAFVEQFDVDADQFSVIALDLEELLADVLPVMIRNFDIAALDNDVHA
jgi:hypothetical protein